MVSGGTLTTKNSGFWRSKVQIFGAEGAENFEKIAIIKGHLAIFVLLGKFWPNLDWYSVFGLIWTQNNVIFSDFEKVGKISQIFWKFWEIFRKKFGVPKVQISKILS